MRNALFILAAMLASCGQSAPVVQVGDPKQPAVPVNIAATVPVSMPIQVGPTTQPLVTVQANIERGAITASMPVSIDKGAFTANVQVGPTSQPLVNLTNPVTVNLPDMTLPAVVIAASILVAMLLHVLAGHYLAARRAKRERLSR